MLGIIMGLLIVNGVQFYKAWVAEKRLEAEVLARQKEIQEEIENWQKKALKYPGHRDIYLKLASLYWQAGNDDSARENLKKALAIDPNSETAKELKKIIPD